jgi:fluoroquinolone transport system ATP-binding protein
MNHPFSVKSLSFAYDKKKGNVIENISFDIPQGSIFGLLGPSGAGKSTTQKILIKLLQDYQGSATYFGKELKTIPQSYYEDIGVGFEMPVHFNKLTGMENLKFFASLYKKHIDLEAMMIRVGLMDAMNQEVGQYSKGMKMRLNFVKALLNDPSILFLDEPTNGLDPSNARIIKDIILEEKKKGKTILITTHLMQDVEELCDQVAFIAKGKLIETSSPKALKLKYGKRQIIVEYEEKNELKSALFSLEKLDANLSFQTLLQSSKIITIHSQETSLDKIFIEITGDKHV